MVDITCDPVDLNNACTVTWSVSNLMSMGICTIGTYYTSVINKIELHVYLHTCMQLHA